MKESPVPRVAECGLRLSKMDWSRFQFPASKSVGDIEELGVQMSNRPSRTVNRNVFKNRILQSLDLDVIQHLHLKALKLPSALEIENPGEPIRNLIFIEDGIGSMTTTFGDGFQIGRA